MRELAECRTVAERRDFSETARHLTTGAGVGTVQHQAWHTVVYEKTSGIWQVVRAQTTAVGGFPPSNP